MFVWTKMGTESGEELARIVKRKEAERVAGNGIFWWGIGKSLGSNVRSFARAQGDTLPVIFSCMLSRAKIIDTSPKEIFRWTRWENEDGASRPIPQHVKVISRGAPDKGRHYALVCRSEGPIELATKGERFDPRQCLTPSGKVPGASQVTALLEGSIEGHPRGNYEISFRAILIAPYAPKLLAPVRENRD